MLEICFLLLLCTLSQIQGSLEIERKMDIMLQRLEILERKVDTLESENVQLKEDKSKILRLWERCMLKADNSETTPYGDVPGNENKKIDVAKAHHVKEVISQKVLKVKTPQGSKFKRLLSSSFSPAPVDHMAFTVYLGKTIDSLGSLQTIEYDTVLVNDGGAYDPRHGHFLVPANGIYQLSASLFATPGQRVALDMVRNGNRIGTLFADASGASHHVHSSKTVNIALEQGDMVWMRTYPGFQGPALNVYSGLSYNTFSGILLYKK